MEPETLLLISCVLPLFGAAALWVVGPLGPAAVRWVALGTTLLTAVAAGWVVAGFVAAAPVPDLYAALDWNWLSASEAGSSPWNVRLSLGLDGISVWLYGLTALLMVSSVLVSWRAIDHDEGLFFGMLLLLEAACLGVFCAQDILLFYICFEFTLVPLYFLIGIWGSEQRRWAARKFFLYTLAGSVLTFLSLLGIVLWTYRTTGVPQYSIESLTAVMSSHPMPLAWQHVVFWGLFAGFAIKVPLFPLHTWLPLAHVQAPTAGSVFLAGILLKMGTYGFLRLSIPFLPEAAVVAAPALLVLALAGILYGALVALAQADIKRLIAYSSVSHLGFCMLGLFALTPLALRGGALQMVNHGISTGALFAMVGMLYERFHTRQIEDLSGLARRMPWLAFFFLVFTFSSIGLPGTNGFAGEFMILIGTFQRAWAVSGGGGGAGLLVIAVLAVSGVVVGAWYMLQLVRRVFWGPWKSPVPDEQVVDLCWRERLALAPLAVFVFWIGLQPTFFTRPMDPAVQRVSMPAQLMWRQELPEVTAGSEMFGASAVAGEVERRVKSGAIAGRETR